MPVFIVQYNGTAVDKSVQIGHNLIGLFGHGFVQVLAGLVVLIDLSGFLQSKGEIFFSKQVNGFFSVLNTSGGIDTGTYFEYNVTDSDILVRQSAYINDGFQSYTGIAVQLL